MAEEEERSEAGVVCFRDTQAVVIQISDVPDFLIFIVYHDQHATDKIGHILASDGLLLEFVTAQRVQWK